MSPHLLLGAGFSRNWGGWLANEVIEYLLGDAVVIRNAVLRDLLWKHKAKGGFEAALDDLRQNARCDGTLRQLLAGLELSIVKMFDAMNSGFRARQFEFQHSLVNRLPLQNFLSRFSSIFTLNQDLLLETHYLADKDNRGAFESWKSWQLPGMELASREINSTQYPAATGTWQPSMTQVVGPEQPIFKLHGSSNWRTADSQEMLILGGGKKAAIGQYPVLEWYFTEFSRRLHQPGARLMVIGYSFQDDHVNGVLSSAIANGLKLFVIDPKGSDVAKAINPTAIPGQIYSKTTLEMELQTALIGASRRELSAIFGGDAIELAKVARFFEDQVI